MRPLSRSALMVAPTLALLLLATGRARSQDRAPPGPAPREAAPIGSLAPAPADLLPAETSPVGSSGEGVPLEALLSGRDPFGTPGGIKARASGAFVPGPQGAIPKLSLRGYVEVKKKGTAALIEIEGQGVYVVRVGDTIGITFGGRSTVLRVQALSASSARVEAGSLGQVIVVR